MYRFFIDVNDSMNQSVEDMPTVISLFYRCTWAVGLKIFWSYDNNEWVCRGIKSFLVAPGAHNVFGDAVRRFL